MPLSQERTMVEKAESALERTELERINALVIEVEVADTVLEPKTAPITTPMPNLVSATTSQDILATLTIAKTLLLLTSKPQFDRIATPVYSKSAKSLESQSHHTANYPLEHLPM